MNINQRCYGYEPASRELKKLRECQRILTVCLREQYDHGMILSDTYEEARKILHTPA